MSGRPAIVLLAFLTSGGGGHDGNPVDDILGRVWKENKIRPVGPASDAEFLRRVRLDLTGTIPDPEEVRTFLADTASNKRVRKIDELLRSPEFSAYWADRLAAILLGYDQKQIRTIPILKGWLEKQLAEGVPYDRIVRELLTARGFVHEEPAAAYVAHHYLQDRLGRELTVRTARVFLGIQLQCAQCHDHPFDRWKKSDFLGMNAFFARTQVRVIEEKSPDGKRVVDRKVEVLDRPARGRGGGRGQVRVQPKLLGGPAVSEGNLREELARWIVSPDNPWFARATVNRVWSEFFGRAFVLPVDDFQEKNPPALPELLDALADDFRRSGHDLRGLMRTIVTSRAYQLTSAIGGRKFEDEEKARNLYAFQIVRPMTPQQFVNSLLRAQGGAGGEGIPEDLQQRLEQGRLRFLRSFVATGGGEDPPDPGEYNATIMQVLGLLDAGSPLYRGISAGGRGRLAKMFRDRGTKPAPAGVVTELFLATLSRPPTESELADCLAWLREQGSGPTAYQDLLFLLLNTNEFFFQH